MKTVRGYTFSAAVSVVAVWLSTTAFASDFEDRCIVISMNDTRPSDMSEADIREICSCLAEITEADPSMMAALEPGLYIADFEERMASVGDAGQKALEACS